MKCNEARPLFSCYLDGAVTGRQMQGLSTHLAACSGCAAELKNLQRTQQSVASLGRRPVPPELALRLRVAVSQEAARQRSTRWDSLRVRWENAVNAFMVPATAGLVSATVIFGLLIGFFALPAELQAINDVPTMLYTPPELAVSPFSQGVAASDSLIIEAYVDAQGRVQDYRIISAPPELQGTMEQVRNMMIFTVFKPATSFGRPTAGRALLTFSKVSVQG